MGEVAGAVALLDMEYGAWNGSNGQLFEKPTLATLITHAATHSVLEEEVWVGRVDYKS